MIETERLKLCPWRGNHRDAFAQMNADPEVMQDLGGPLDRVSSDVKFDRYAATFAERGISRWALENKAGTFLGYAGVMPNMEIGHPLGTHFEIGWRLVRDAWGFGYATEAARAVLADAFDQTKVSEILSYTAPENTRSQAVMRRLGLERDPSRDFTMHYDGIGEWSGLVWVARRS